jgi:hypothetical protein
MAVHQMPMRVKFLDCHNTCLVFCLLTLCTADNCRVNSTCCAVGSESRRRCRFCGQPSILKEWYAASPAEDQHLAARCLGRRPHPPIGSHRTSSAIKGSNFPMFPSPNATIPQPIFFLHMCPRPPHPVMHKKGGGLRRGAQQRLGRRLEEVAKAVGGG